MNAPLVPDTTSVHLDRNDIRCLEAAGVSMGRTVLPGRRLLVCSPESNPPQHGSLIVYQQGERSVVHRAVRKMKRPDGIWWITKGDGFLRCDRLAVPESHITGVVVGMLTEQGVSMKIPKGLWHVVAGYLESFTFRPVFPDVGPVT